jgi:hypothetical protein
MNTNLEITNIEINVNEVILTSNFDIVKKQLEDGLKTFDIEVNQENLKQAKEFRASINNLAKEIKKKEKEKLEPAMNPIKEFKEKIKSLVITCDNASEKLDIQIKNFETAERERILRLINLEIKSLYEIEKVESEFQAINFDISFIKPSIHTTDAGHLSKQIKEIISIEVKKCLDLQKKVEYRLIHLENLSLKNGLKSTLERRHIESFLKEEDETYNSKLQDFISREVERQQEMEAKIKAEEERKANELIEAERRKNEEEKKKAEIEMQKKLQEEKERVEKETRLKVEQENKIKAEEKPATLPQEEVKSQAIDLEHDVFEIFFQLKVKKGALDEEAVREKIFKDIKEKYIKSFNDIIFVRKI